MTIKVTKRDPGLKVWDKQITVKTQHPTKPPEKKHVDDKPPTISITRRPNGENNRP